MNCTTHKSILRIALSLVFALSTALSSAQVTNTYTTTTDWVVPACVYSVTVQVWGAGGAGGGSSATDRNGGGGGGGAFCSFTETVTPGETLRITVGTGGVGVNSGTGGSGGFSQVEHLTGSVVFCRAAGGAGGQKGANASSAGAGGQGGQIINNIPSNTGFRGGNGGNSDPNTASSDRSGGGGGGAGTGANGGNGGIVTAGAGGAAGGGNGGAGVTTTSNGGANGVAGNTIGGGGGGSTTYNSGSRAGANGARGEVRITYTVGGCCPPPAIPVGISGNANPCVGATEVYSTSSAGATDFLWELPAGWMITSGANTNTITVTVGVGGGAIAVSPANNCDTLTPTILPINLCGAPAANTVYTAPGTYTWIVPPCVTSVYVQAWGAGGGGGGIASQGVSCFICSYVEACSAGGGGGGGGYTSRSYEVVPGESYTIVVGAGGTAGPASSSSTATARDGGVGGNSTFSGPATLSLGTLTGLGGAAGKGARTLHNGSSPDHQGNNGLGGIGSSGSNGTVSFTGGNGAVGMHSASCWDLSGGGGGGAGSSANGNNATALVCYGSVAGGSGGSASGGSGGNGRADNGINTQSFPGNAGNVIGGGGGGALIHLRDYFNTWVTQPGGVGARGEVRLTFEPCSALPITLVSFDATCDGTVREFNWKTASESNNDYFTIEHSMDGKLFTVLQLIDGKGTSQSLNSYSTRINDNPEYQYYRLSQTDFNGSMNTSAVISVECNEMENMSFSVYPNPADNEVSVYFKNTAGLHNVLVHDLQGRMVYSKMVDVSEGLTIDLDISGLKSGNYILEVWSNETQDRIGVSRLSKE